MLSLLLIFRWHLPWIHWALWHALSRSVALSMLQTLTMVSLPPTAHGDTADVPQAGNGEHASHLVYNESSSVKSCLFLCGHAQYFSRS